MLSINQDTRESIVVVGDLYPSSRHTINHAQNASGLTPRCRPAGAILRKKWRNQ